VVAASETVCTATAQHRKKEMSNVCRSHLGGPFDRHDMDCTVLHSGLLCGTGLLVCCLEVPVLRDATCAALDATMYRDNAALMQIATPAWQKL
jgi:hypothetical protein